MTATGGALPRVVVAIPGAGHSGVSAPSAYPRRQGRLLGLPHLLQLGLMVANAATWGYVLQLPVMLAG